MAKKRKNAYWPGPTRLYDPEVDVGAVLLTSNHAAILVKVVADALRLAEYSPRQRHAMATAAATIIETFGLGD